MRLEWAQVLGVLQAVPAVIALARATTGPLRTCAAVLIAIDAAVVFGWLVGMDLHRAPPVVQIIVAAALVVLAILIAVRVKSGIIGTLLITAGALEAVGLLAWVR